VVGHDVIVIGSGPAAYAAAIQSSKLGLDVLLVEPEPCAGAAVTAGAVPPRLRRAVACRILTHHEAARRSGEPLAPRTLSVGELSRRANEMAQAYLENLQRGLRESCVQLRSGPTRFDAPDQVCIDSGDLRRAETVVIATGTRPRRPGSFPFDDRVVCDPESTFRAGGSIRSLLVVGANDEGCEISCLFSALGASVTLVDRRAQLLRSVDRDLLNALHVRMRRTGIEIVLEEDIESIEVKAHSCEPNAVVTLASGRVEQVARVSICAGWLPNVEALELERAGVERDPMGFIVTDEHCQTSRRGIYAVGDVAGVPCELGTQLYQARVAVLHAAGMEPTLDEHVPRSIYTIPELGTVGLSEEACARLGVPYAVGRAPHPSASMDGGAGAVDGVVKLVVEKESGRVFGIHVIGEHARELLQLGMDLLRREASVDSMASATFAAPSLMNAFRLAALDALDPVAR